MRIDLPQVQVVDPRVIGRAAVVAALTGTPDDLGGSLKATLGEGRLLDRKTSGLTLEAEAKSPHRAPRSAGVAVRRHRRPPA